MPEVLFRFLANNWGKGKKQKTSAQSCVQCKRNKTYGAHLTVKEVASRGFHEKQQRLCF